MSSTRAPASLPPSPTSDHRNRLRRTLVGLAVQRCRHPDGLAHRKNLSLLHLPWPLRLLLSSRLGHKSLKSLEGLESPCSSPRLGCLISKETGKQSIPASAQQSNPLLSLERDISPMRSKQLGHERNHPRKGVMRQKHSGCRSCLESRKSNSEHGGAGQGV